ncbi:MAG TPA: acyl-ACP thioesterase domain-containing protein [Acidimicrobiia bacterium]|nr:acyl-ACP thioesterase domain-containing protein [Acidimicrobiia bacterium]
MRAPDVDPEEFRPLPAAGRRVTRERVVRLGDVTNRGRARLDALAGYLQDVAADDVDDAGLVGAWVLRRLVLALGEPPGYRDLVELTTFCSGTGSRFAERRTTLTVAGRVAVEAVALWVYVDEVGRPARLRDWFFDSYGEAAAGRRVRSRLHHPPPPDDATVRAWPLRISDVDVLDHVNNAASWAAVEDELGRRHPDRTPARAEMEYRRPVDLDEVIELRTSEAADGLACWLTRGDEVRTSARVWFA